MLGVSNVVSALGENHGTSREVRRRATRDKGLTELDMARSDGYIATASWALSECC